VERLIETYGGDGGGGGNRSESAALCRSSSSSGGSGRGGGRGSSSNGAAVPDDVDVDYDDAVVVDLIVADQRDSQFGDMNAGTMLLRVNAWTLSFLEAWWDHPLAQQVSRHLSLSPFSFLKLAE
jgi:hypothetical protein